MYTWNKHIISQLYFKKKKNSSKFQKAKKKQNKTKKTSFLGIPKLSGIPLPPVGSGADWLRF